MRTHIRIDHSAPVAAAKAAPGVWQFVASYPSSTSAGWAKARIPKATRMPSYGPAGSFEAYVAPHEDGGSAVWTRYVVGVTDLKPRPKTMTYRVCDRGSGREYVGVRIVTVTVKAECPRCGGPRGTATHHRFCEDGEWYSVARWSNACGHEDSYEAVLAEHHKRLQAFEDAEERAAARAVVAGPDDAVLPALLRDSRPVADVAWLRVAESENPLGFKACMTRTVAALGRGEDLTTAAWTAADPVRLAAEIEVLTGARRLALTPALKESK